MALTLTIPGGKTQLSGNRIQAELQTDTLTGDMYNLLLKTTSLDGSFPEGIDAIEPDENNKALFDIRNRVTSPIVYSFTWPLTGAVEIEQPQMAKKVAVDIGERYVQVVNNENVDTINWSELAGEQYQVLILRGGISKHEQAKYNEQNTTFYTEFISAGKFLTLLPDNMKIAPGQPVKLWFITKEATSQALNLKVNFTNLDSTTGTINIAVTIEPGQMFEMCVDSGSLGLNTSEIASYSVQLEKEGVTISEIRNFSLDHNYYENNSFILCANRIGGIDCLWFSGKIIHQFLTKSERSQRDARITDTQQRPTLEVDYKTGKRKWTINTGHKLPGEMKALTGLFESRNVWILDGNDIIPVMLDDNDNELLDTMENLHNIDLNFTEAH